MNFTQKEYAYISVTIIILYFIYIFFKPLLSTKKKNKKRKKKYINSNMQMVDQMKGIEFEEFLFVQFKNKGYKVELTKATNDYGADLLLEKNNRKTIVQAKRYSSKIGIKAIQEATGAIKYFKAENAIVVTNNYFTKNAIALAKVNNVDLWNRDDLIKIMKNKTVQNEAIEVIKKTASEKKCPMCQFDLLVKNGQFGQFYGCSQYPKCTFTRNIKSN